MGPSVLVYDKRIFKIGMTKYAKIAFIAEKGVQFFVVTKMFITPTFSTSTGFMMAHFEAKKHGKTIESHKSNVAKGQMSAKL